jgi:GTP-binding protein HflX
VARLTCKRKAPDAALFVGSGKADEIRLLAETEGHARCCSTRRSARCSSATWSAPSELPVNDRTLLILEIFAQRARSHEGKLQVELARLQYLSTRLVRRWSHLERQQGGIGGRGGPGETQIELDRRMIGEAIKRTKERLAQGQAPAPDPAPPARAARDLQHFAGRLHQRRQVHAVQCPGQGARLRGRPAVRHAGHHHAPALPGRGRPLGLAVRHRGLHPRPAARPDRGLPRPRCRRPPTPTCCCMWSTPPTPAILEQMAEVQRVLHEIGADEVPQVLVFNKLDAWTRRAAAAPAATRMDVEGGRRGRALSSAPAPARACRCCALELALAARHAARCAAERTRFPATRAVADWAQSGCTEERTVNE